MLLDKYAHSLYQNNSIKSIENEHHNIYKIMLDNGFIIEDSIDEKNVVINNCKVEQNDTTIYHLVVNPTLDCNLSCWYCYENKIKNSKITNETINGIKKHIDFHFKNTNFTALRLSFFGGEPFLDIDAILNLASYSYNFCRGRNINFTLDFTTNGTILTQEVISKLSIYKCTFQITIDGNEEQHNRIKHCRNNSCNTYRIVLNNIRSILKLIPNSHVYLRINYDEKTLMNFEDIIKDILFMDRRRTTIILKKVWQKHDTPINNKLICNIIQTLFNHNFIVDYYSQGGLCFAERKNQAVINYDGNVFKCTTIDNFDIQNAFGKLNVKTGRIEWEEEKIKNIYSKKYLQRCLNCKMLPTCYGPCNFHINTGKNECFMNIIDLSKKEYLMYLYKNMILQSQLKNMEP